MADVCIMRTIQDYGLFWKGLFWNRTSGSVLYLSSKLALSGLPAGGAAEGPELGYGARGATCGSTAGLDALL